MDWESELLKVLSLAALTALALLHLQKPSPKDELANSVKKKLAWGVLIICSLYFSWSSTEISSFRPTESKLKPPTAENVLASPDEYIRENQKRIDDLEKELRETKSELRHWKKDYEVQVDLLFYAILVVGLYQIFKRKNVSFFGNGE